MKFGRAFSQPEPDATAGIAAPPTAFGTGSDCTHGVVAGLVSGVCAAAGVDAVVCSTAAVAALPAAKRRKLRFERSV